MTSWRNVTKYRKSIALLLITVILLLKVFPSHLHIHPETELHVDHHGHTVNFHSATDLMHFDHGNHNDAIEIKVATDNLLKHSKLNAINFYLFGLILAIITIVLLHARHNPIRSTLPRYTSYHHFTPLLRAPPSL